MKRFVSPAEAAEIQALRAQGLTQPEIAQRLGRSLSTIQRRTTQHRCRNPQEVTPEEAEDIHALRAEGLSQAEIARCTGRSLRTVERHTTQGGGSVRKTARADVEQMLRLAADGLGRAEIAAITGWSIRTVGKHVGHIVPRRDIPTPDIERYRRMIKAAEAAEYGMGDQIAARFGLKSARVLWVALVTARRRVAEADRQEAA